MDTATGLNVRAFAITSGLFFSGTVLCVSLLSGIAPGYGDAVLELFSSLYPFYDADGSVPDILIGAVLALLDGVVGGAIFAWLYNRLVAAVAPVAPGGGKG